MPDTNTTAKQKRPPKPMTDIDALKRIQSIIEQLPEPERARVADYIAAKYAPPAAPQMRLG